MKKKKKTMTKNVSKDTNFVLCSLNINIISQFYKFKFWQKDQNKISYFTSGLNLLKAAVGN